MLMALLCIGWCNMEKRLYYVSYGCWQQSEDLIISAESLENAQNWAYQEAKDLWESWNSDDYENWEEEVDARENEIEYSAEPYDPNNPDHIIAYDEDGVFEI